MRGGGWVERKEGQREVGEKDVKMKEARSYWGWRRSRRRRRRRRNVWS